MTVRCLAVALLPAGLALADLPRPEHGLHYAEPARVWDEMSPGQRVELVLRRKNNG